MARSRQRGRVDAGTSRIAGLAVAAIDAVGVGGQRRHPAEAVERNGQRQSIFLRASATPLGIGDRNRELAAADDRHPAAGLFGRASQVRVLLRRLARFTGYGVAKG